MAAYLRALAAAAFAVAALVAAGCGGGKPLSTAQYHKRANAICAATVGRIRSLAPPRSFAARGPYLDRVDGYVKDLVSRLGKLDPPPRLHATHKDAVEQATRLESAFRTSADRAKAAKSPPAATKALLAQRDKTNAVGSKLDADLRKLGLKACV